MVARIADQRFGVSLVPWLCALAVMSIASLVAKAEDSLGYSLANVFPHDSSAFTQGLIVEDGFFIEGAGLRAHSELRRVELVSGRVIARHKLQPRFFGEGVTALDGLVYQLTWTSGLGFVYDLETFRLQRTFHYDGEGWGLTHDGELLIMSSGTEVLRFLKPSTLEQVKRLTVVDEDGPVRLLNELEFINGKIFANVYRSDRIVEIDPVSGRVTRSIDLGAIGASEKFANRRAKELNGIAYDEATDRLFVTGKNWAHVYQIVVD